MKRIIVIILLLYSSLAQIQAQGFNWQYSSRLPFNYPYLFVGLNGSVDLLYHDAILNLSEGNGDCCNFKIGRGLGTNIGLSSEYWLNYEMALNLKLNFVLNDGKFITSGSPLPFSVFDSEHRVIGHDTAYFENEMTTRINYLTINAGGKILLFNTHFHAGINLGFSYLVNSRIIQSERVTKPSYWTYSDGSKERVIADYDLTGISKFYFSPAINLGYDLPLIIGIYATPYISLGFPAVNIANKGRWQFWNLSFGVSVLNAISSK